MNEAATVESERLQKQRKNTISKTPKPPKPPSPMNIQEQSAEVVKPKIRKTLAVVSSQDSELHETVRLLREEMAEIRKTINSSQGPTHQLKTSIKLRV